MNAFTFSLLDRTSRVLFNSVGRPLFVFASGLLLCAIPATADVIYDNSVNDRMVRLDPGAYEVGDQIVLSGTARYVTNFSFEYWGTSSTPGAFAGYVQCCIRMYLNDGVPFNDYPTPGTKFFDSGWFRVQPTERSVLVFGTGDDFPPEGLRIPGAMTTELTWSVQFRGLGNGDAAGVDLYGPLATGLGYPDYWVKRATGWQLEENQSVPVNFAARMEASQTPILTRPSLKISNLPGNRVVVSWPSWAQNYELQTSTSIGLGESWSAVSTGIYLEDDIYVRTNTVAPGAKLCFRLRRLP